MFKCLTDTIMLDDFKTELKRLGIKRMRQDEMRRQSFALVAGLAITLNLEAAALRVLPGAEEKAPGTTAAYFLLARRTVDKG